MPNLRILVLEAGGSDRALTVQMPSALSIAVHSRRFNWGMKSELEPGLNERVMSLPRGKGLGRSSSINGMCYVRGNPMDYELWSSLGAKGRNWAHVLPYFKRLESTPGGRPLRGIQGPISIMSPTILKRSDIGPAAELRHHGIDLVLDLPEVGENLMDHLEIYLQQESIQPISLYPHMSLLGKAMIRLRWLLTHRGLGASITLKVVATFAAVLACPIPISSFTFCH
ncbi:GMC family oxidoreductase N-terminal domain-containing protein [Pseudophaeobacter sp.]|uniref:GMC family oxidoreductase N-terminal domain-containing protein n=1 Tax=Pseudophaeobacter sp. TaxID=1971739 RepID=UPI00329719C7